MTMFSATLSQCLAMMSSDEEHQTFVNWAKDRLEEVAIPKVAGGLEDQAGVGSSPESLFRADLTPPRTKPRTVTPSRPTSFTTCPNVIEERRLDQLQNRRPRRLGQLKVNLQPKRVPQGRNTPKGYISEFFCILQLQEAFEPPALCRTKTGLKEQHCRSVFECA